MMKVFAEGSGSSKNSAPARRGLGQRIASGVKSVRRFFGGRG